MLFRSKVIVNMINIFEKVVFMGELNLFLELFVAQTFFMARQKKRSLFPLRLLIVLVLAVPLYFLPSLTVGTFRFSYLVQILLIFLCGVFCYKPSMASIVFFTISALSAQHISWHLMYMLIESFNVNNQAVAIFIYVFSCLLVDGVFLLILNKKASVDIINSKRINAIFIAILIVMITFVFGSLVAVFGGWNVLYRLYTILCCLGVFALQYWMLASDGLLELNTKLTRDNMILEELLYQQQKNQDYAKDTMEFINMKCHDFKNQLSLLKNLSGNERDESISEMEKNIVFYDSFAKTGNTALDVVLTEKALLCEKYHIRFTYIADGELLAFMEQADISALFNNAISNAVESAIKQKDFDRRIIRLNISQSGKMLYIHVENFCDEYLMFKDGLPLTTKDEKSEHGFGVKSIRYIVEKNNGNLIMSLDDNMFNLDIIIPMCT